MDVSQILEQNVEVIKVILQEQCQQMRFFFLRERVVRELWAAREELAAPHSLPHASVGVLEGAVGSTFRTCCPTV